MAAGSFSASALADIMIATEQVFTGERHRQGIRKDVSAAQAILARQKVNWVPVYEGGVNDGSNCIGFKAVWLKNCDDTVDDCSLSDCNLSGIEIESDNTTYRPNFCKNIGRKALGKLCNNFFTKEDLIAKELADAITLMDQTLQSQLLAFIIANAQENRAKTDGPGTWDAGDNAMRIPSAQMTADIIGDIIYNADANDLHEYYGITGKNFMKDFWRGKLNECCDSDAKIFDGGGLDLVFAGAEFDTAAGFKATAVVDSGALGYFNVNDYMNESPQLFSAKDALYTWRVPSRRLAYNSNGTLIPVYYDVEMQDSCSTASNRRSIDTVINVRHKGGIVLAPPTCNAADTGILLFEDYAGEG